MSVQALRARLTRDDVQRLAQAGDDEGRALAARKICSRISMPGLSEKEREAANAILSVLANDAAEIVRRAMSVTLARSVNLPRDIARKLAEDIDSIAVPVIAGSPSLTEEDLVEVVRSGAVVRQTAVAGRAEVPGKVVREIVMRAGDPAVQRVIANDGAHFDAGSYALSFERYRDRPDMLEGFVERTSLPLEVTEKLINVISEAAVERLISRHAIPAQLAVELAEATRERATVDLVDQAGLAPDPRRFVQQLQMNGRLTPSLILRALFRGHMTFFEHCLAELAGIPHAKAWLLIHDAGPLGLDALFERSGLPRRILPAVRAAISAYHSLELGDRGPEDIVRFRAALTQRIFTQFQGAPEADLEYCLARLETDMDAYGFEPHRRMAG
ncbi:MAG: DUF2336 domain-containing protein [Oceanicaulis sp.]|uniref:DUF2336 domain-containing protein n=1 Tax=Glycocaulis sp. TaxID=1969725 RepID=UPI0025BDA986|nr:DUF2336 domain-containing protein [Glycocaulis sp.]MCC5980795.1 DUF2336 domain-containing protein [Oceanicaulis sp.]MCH8521626.1 DUF2336 domain-containing protein [Glycocaulis sp.]